MIDISADIERTLAPHYAREPDALAFTQNGIWLPTPLSVLGSAAMEIARRGFIRENNVIFDAGAGDGRVLAALGVAFANVSKLRLIGIECDEQIAGRGQRLLSALSLARDPRLICGDYDDPKTLGMLGLAFSDFDLIMHYPDGNEAKLHERFIGESKVGARLILLSPQLSSVLHDEPNETIRLPAEETAMGRAHATWTMSVYEK